MTQQEFSPTKKSALQRLNQENTQLRDQLTLVQQQKLQFQRIIKKQQGQLKVWQTKYNVIDGQLTKLQADNHRYIEAYEKEKKERLQLVNNQQAAINNLNRDQAELLKLTSENKSLKIQNQTLQKALQQEKGDRVSALRQKQNNTNKIMLLQTKLQASTVQAKYAKITTTELQNENKRLRQSVSQLQKQLNQNQTPLHVETIYKESGNTEKLLKEFQEKIKEKETLMVREIQNYERKNSQLALRIAELQMELLSVKS